MKKEKISFSIRISSDLLRKIKIIAKRQTRSANREIEYILQRYVDSLYPIE